MTYIPSWKHNASNFRKRMKQYAQRVAEDTAKQEKPLGFPPALRVAMPQHVDDDIASYPYTNQIMSMYPPVDSTSSEGSTTKEG
jgi:hypothetical protein